MFLFLLQLVWLYISELAGKDLELSVIFKFIFYSLPSLIPLALPLSILFSSIMVFGEFAEHYEFAAIKSTGISLQRAMRTLIIFSVFLGFGTFYFSNNVIPASQRKFINLRRSIFKLKPARLIIANQFNEVGDAMNLKIGEKYGDNDQFLNDVLIHKRNPNKAGNFTVIKSKKGELISSEDSNVLSLVLTDGHYYDEIQVRKAKNKKKRPYIKTDFKEYAINIDLSDLNGDVDLSEENYTKNRKMLNAEMLRKDIDSFSNQLNTDVNKFNKRMYNRVGFSNIKNNLKLKCETTEYPVSITDILSADARLSVINEAKRDTQSGLSRIKQHITSEETHKKRLNKFEIALHEKYALGVGCIVLFFIGAPLGAIIRKGGLGLPLLYAFAIFLAYTFIGIFAKNSAEDGVMSPFLASWFSTLLVLPLGILFTYRATTDKGLINFEGLISKLMKLFKK